MKLGVGGGGLRVEMCRRSRPSLVREQQMRCALLESTDLLALSEECKLTSVSHDCNGSGDR